ncbi:hypothetical protein DL93DRAFT_2076913 [Clavulina sp. PMI_390]|nr:hypothetical protein DL93DRAFT_2076913 [Clavulina sp. PMI_390]
MRGLSLSIAGPGVVCALRSYSSSSEHKPPGVFVFGLPNLFSTQEEAHREGNITRYPLLHQIETTGGEPFLVKPRLMQPVGRPTIQELEGSGGQPVLLHLIRSVGGNGHARHQSACYKLSIPHTVGNELHPLSTSYLDNKPSIDSTGREISCSTTCTTSASLSPNTSQLEIRHAEFLHRVSRRYYDSMLEISPLGDVVKISLEATEKTNYSPWGADPDVGRNSLLVETLCSDDFMVTDKCSLSTAPKSGSKDSDKLPYDEDPKLIDFGEASRVAGMCIDWWNGAIVQQAQTAEGHFYLRIRKIAPAVY